MFKRLKYFIILVGAVTALAYVFDLGYLVNGVYKTYLKGHKGPHIYDIENFTQAPIRPSEQQSEGYKTTVKVTLSDFPGSLKADQQALGTEFMSVSKGKNMLFLYQSEENKREGHSNSFSMAKSFTTLCVAKAIDLGFIKSWDEPVGNYLPEASANIKEQGVGNFLGMCSGMDWIESGSNPFSDNAKAYYGNNLNKLVLSKSADKNLIGKYEYKSGNTQIAAMVLEASTGLSLPQFFEKYFWRNIAEHKAYWGKDAAKDGDAKAYCCVYAHGLDFHRMGQLMLDSGVFGQDTLLPQAYFNDFYKPYAQTTVNDKANKAYGLGFWLETYKGYKIHYARGILGQYIICIPELEMVITRLGKKRMNKNEREHPEDLYLYLDFALSLL